MRDFSKGKLANWISVLGPNVSIRHILQPSQDPGMLVMKEACRISGQFLSFSQMSFQLSNKLCKKYIPLKKLFH